MSDRKRPNVACVTARTRVVYELNQLSQAVDRALRNRGGGIALASLAGLGVAMLPEQALADTFTVTNLDDSGPGSLRDAINAANGNAGADDVVFDQGLAGTITLTSGEIGISEEITITGPGADEITVDGNGSSRIFTITADAPTQLSGLTLTGGQTSGSGGAIHTDSDLSLISSNVSGNAGNLGGGGILGYQSNLSIENSTVSDNTGNLGGGIQVSYYSTLTLTNSTISGNTGSRGGGVYGRYGSGLTIENSTISGNSATGDGGGIHLDYDSELTLTNSTISGNSAQSGGGGIYIHADSMDEVNLDLTNSILSGNTAAAGYEEFYIYGSNFSWNTKYNLIEGSHFPSPGELAGNILGEDAELGPLQDNGGPTFTHAIGSGSPAFNAGDPDFTSPPNHDQRGSEFDRVIAGRLDMGAFEFQPIEITLAISPDPADIAEDGGQATISACLEAPVDEDVASTLAVGGSATAGVDHDLADGETLTIPSGETCSEVILTAISDDRVEADESVDISLDTLPNGYTAGDPDTVSAEIVDDDTASIDVNPTSGLVTTEGGDTDAFEVMLTSEPAAEVTIDVASDDPGEGTASPATLTFDAGNWNSAQTVTVTGQNDDQVDGNIVYTIVLGPAQSSDPDYDGQDPTDVEVTNLDDLIFSDRFEAPVEPAATNEADIGSGSEDELGDPETDSRERAGDDPEGPGLTLSLNEIDGDHEHTVQVANVQSAAFPTLSPMGWILLPLLLPLAAWRGLTRHRPGSP